MQVSDLVQETLIRLVQKHRDGDFDSSKGAIENYAFGIAKFLRFIPSLREISNPISVDNLPIAGTGVSISDNQG